MVAHHSVLVFDVLGVNEVLLEPVAAADHREPTTRWCRTSPR